MLKRILYTAADVNYLTQLCVLILSLVESQTQEINLKVLGTGWREQEKHEIQQLGSELIHIDFIDVEIDALEEVNLTYGFPVATIYSLLAPKYYESIESRIIYVDSDIVVMQDISELWSLPFSHPVGAVVDSHIGVIGNPSMSRPWRELGIDPLSAYLNTGLLVVNVEEWNRLNITEQCLNMLSKYVMPCLDQDALSLVLAGNFYQIHPKYNLMPFHLTPKLRVSDLIVNSQFLREAIANPAIIHFHRSFFGKPWNIFCTHPYRTIWRSYAAQIRPKYKRKIEPYNLLRNVAASLAGLNSLDDEVNASRNLEDA
jgi:lipopolysaccharide biosynthesis glycosyltransferase